MPDTYEKILTAIEDMRKDLGEKVANLTERVGKVEERLSGYHQQCQLKHTRVDERIFKTEEAIDELEAEKENTGKISIKKLEDELSKRDDRSFKWVFWVVTSLISAVVGGGVASFLPKILTIAK